MIWARKEFYLSIFRLLDDFCLLLSKEFSESFAWNTRSSLMWPWPVRMVSHWLRWILVQNILTHWSELEDSSSAKKKTFQKHLHPALAFGFYLYNRKVLCRILVQNILAHQSRNNHFHSALDCPSVFVRNFAKKALQAGLGHLSGLCCQTEWSKRVS